MTNQPTPTIQSQRGGTLIGLVIGLLIGLGAALAVAIYVTKVPVPFVDRNVSRNPAQDAVEAERNKGWNPNATLGGRSPAASPVPAPAAAAPLPAAASTEGAIVVPPADGQPLPKPGATRPAAETPATDPLGDLVRSRVEPSGAAQSAAVASAPGAGADPFIYFVQAGAFRSAEDAEAQRAKLAILGIEALVTEREQSGRTVFRVRVGPFNQKALADLTREQLEINGNEAALVRVQR
jgi:cell division protein FtsN